MSAAIYHIFKVESLSFFLLVWKWDKYFSFLLQGSVLGQLKWTIL